MLIKEEFVLINGISTGIYQLGNLSRSDRAIVIIPGNPGLGGFYLPFVHQLYNFFNENVFIMIISQAGHSPPSKHQFTLKEQIQHKIDTIEKLILNENPQCQLIFIGHSIGSYMVLKVLDHFQSKYQRAFLLFPTIERMSESDAGQQFQRWFRLMIYLLPCLCFLIRWIIPLKFLREKLLSFYFSSSPRDDRKALIETIDNDLFNYFAMKNILRMAKEEMHVVRIRPDEIIEKHSKNLVFYYGTNDHWVPQGISDQMRKIYPHADITQCTNQYIHAFVLKHSKELARFVFQKLL